MIPLPKLDVSVPVNTGPCLCCIGACSGDGATINLDTSTKSILNVPGPQSTAPGERLRANLSSLFATPEQEAGKYSVVDAIWEHSGVQAELATTTGAKGVSKATFTAVNNAWENIAPYYESMGDLNCRVSQALEQKAVDGTLGGVISSGKKILARFLSNTEMEQLNTAFSGAGSLLDRLGVALGGTDRSQVAKLATSAFQKLLTVTKETRDPETVPQMESQYVNQWGNSNAKVAFDQKKGRVRRTGMSYGVGPSTGSKSTANQRVVDECFQGSTITEEDRPIFVKLADLLEGKQYERQCLYERYLAGKRATIGLLKSRWRGEVRLAPIWTPLKEFWVTYMPIEGEPPNCPQIDGTGLSGSLETLRDTRRQLADFNRENTLDALKFIERTFAYYEEQLLNLEGGPVSQGLIDLACTHAGISPPYDAKGHRALTQAQFKQVKASLQDFILPRAASLESLYTKIIYSRKIHGGGAAWVDTGVFESLEAADAAERERAKEEEVEELSDIELQNIRAKFQSNDAEGNRVDDLHDLHTSTTLYSLNKSQLDRLFECLAANSKHYSIELTAAAEVFVGTRPAIERHRTKLLKVCCIYKKMDPEIAVSKYLAESDFKALQDACEEVGSYYLCAVELLRAVRTGENTSSYRFATAFKRDMRASLCGDGEFAAISIENLPYDVIRALIASATATIADRERELADSCKILSAEFKAHFHNFTLSGRGQLNFYIECSKMNVRFVKMYLKDTGKAAFSTIEAFEKAKCAVRQAREVFAMLHLIKNSVSSLGRTLSSGGMASHTAILSRGGDTPEKLAVDEIFGSPDHPEFRTFAGRETAEYLTSGEVTKEKMRLFFDLVDNVSKRYKAKLSVLCGDAVKINLAANLAGLKYDHASTESIFLSHRDYERIKRELILIEEQYTKLSSAYNYLLLSGNPRVPRAFASIREDLQLFRRSHPAIQSTRSIQDIPSEYLSLLINILRVSGGRVSQKATIRAVQPQRPRARSHSVIWRNT